MASTSLPCTMRAIIHNQKTQFLTLGTTPLPTPSPTQYLIKSHAVTLTNGELLWPRPKELTVSTPGVEFVGTVVKAPSPSSKFQPGDEVYGRVQYPQPGAAREYTVSDDTELALRPKNISINDAATIPVSALTAWQAFFEQFNLPPPTTSSTAHNGALQHRILINNASGGVGIFAVQLAKLLNLHVTGTTSLANIPFVSSLGADEVLDYRATNVATWAFESTSTRRFDYVLDCAGGASLLQAWHAVKPCGQVRTIVPDKDMSFKTELERPEGVDSSVQGRFFIMHPSGEQLAEITRLVEAGKLRAVVDSVFRLEEFERAFERVAGGGTRGKVVLRVDEEGQE